MIRPTILRRVSIDSGWPGTLRSLSPAGVGALRLEMAPGPVLAAGATSQLPDLAVDALSGSRSSGGQAPAAESSLLSGVLVTPASSSASIALAPPRQGLGAVTPFAGFGLGVASAASALFSPRPAEWATTSSDSGSTADGGRDPGDREARPSGASSPSASPELVLAWNQLCQDLATLARRGPTISSRLYALVDTALYDSWALFDRSASGWIFHPDQKVFADSRYSNGGHASGEGVPSQLREAVMAVAADRVLRRVGASLFNGLLPQALLDRSEALLQQSLSGLVPAAAGGSPQAVLAQSLGEQVAAAINAFALQDGSNQQNNYRDTTGYTPTPSRFDPSNPRASLDTTWQPLSPPDASAPQTALTPQWGGVTPFASGPDLVPDSVLAPFNSDGSLNPLFVAELNEVLQASMNLTARQKAIAEYWEAGPGTSFPPGMWMGFANGLIRDRQLSLDQAVKLSFGVSQALLDAGIGTWATKYAFNCVRPITVIRQYYYGQTTTDWGEALTDWRETPILGQAWQPYQNPTALTPNFPDVNSGHSAFSTAAATFIRNFLGSNVFGKSVTLADNASRFDPNGFDGLPGTGSSITLSWDYLNGAAEQAGISRIYGGIHFTDGNWVGQILGTRAGTNASLKASSLFTGARTPTTTIHQDFGTMAADVLTGLPTGASEGVRELYGFDGDDLLIASGGEDRLDLFGGDGVDRFRLSSHGDVWIRDLQAGEAIELNSALFRDGQTLSDVAFRASDQGPGSTDLSLGRTVLARLDGVWSRAQVNLGTWS